MISREEAQAKVQEIAQGRKEFNIPTEEYVSLDVEVQKELDRNYWRFPDFSRGYKFCEMDEDAKKHFKSEEMVIHHSIFAR